MKKINWKNQNWKKKAANGVFLLLLLLTIISGCVVLSDLARLYREDHFWKKVREFRDAGLAAEEGNRWTPEGILPEYKALYERNPDMVGWLKAEGAKIDGPVMQTKEEPEYYLRRNFDREDDNGGTPFVDYRCSVFPRRSFNVILYGHYTDGDRLFRRLLDYSYEPWAMEHKEFQFDTLEEKTDYEVIAAFFYDGAGAVLNEPAVNEGEQAYTFYNYIELDTKEGFQLFADKIAELSLYRSKPEITPEDRLLTIVCCAPEAFSGVMEEGRFVLIARQVRKE